MKVIILNGPPGVGKDTIADLLDLQGYEKRSFKEPMFQIVDTLLGRVLYEEFLQRYDDRDLKESHWNAIGMSPRELMIHISEDFVKPTMGEKHFGVLAARPLRENSMYVFSDGGFPSEVQGLAEAGADVTVIRLRRKGFSFEGDSRNFILHDSLWKTVDLQLFDNQPARAVQGILSHV